jgi:tRNA (cytidine56-2'-O)-methyltransferase
VGLVARAFGADGLLLSVEDDGLIESLEDVIDRWGGDFFVKVVKDWRGYLKSWKGLIVHLTMYGGFVDDKMEELRETIDDILVVVGAEKVPPDIFKLVHHNISVGSQPHSEIAALAIFLDRFYHGQQLKSKFGGKMEIIPSDDGKKVVLND